MSERSLMIRVLHRLRKLPGCHVIKIHGSRYGRSGEPDLIGCLSGQMFAIELKTDSGKPTALQELRLQQWSAAGARVGIARSVDQALAIAQEVSP